MTNEERLKIAKWDVKVAKSVAGRKNMSPKKKREWTVKLNKANRKLKIAKNKVK
jgi:hypothetical protein